MKVTFIFLSSIILASAVPQNDVKILQASALGISRVYLDGACTRSECNLGNFIADAIVDWNAEKYNGTVGWTDAAIALIDTALIKSSLAKTGTGEILQAHVDSILDGTPIVAVDMIGQQLVSALEHAVHRYEEGVAYHEFLQHSGLIVEYDVSKEIGQRTTSVQVTCADCDSPLIFNISPSKTYRVLMPKTLAEGAHGFTVFAGKQAAEIGATDKQAFLAYLAKKSPIYPAVEWRITINPEIIDENPTTAAPPTTTTDSASGLKISFVLILLSVMTIFKKI
jgi:5'-nucleotidase